MKKVRYLDNSDFTVEVKDGWVEINLLGKKIYCIKGDGIASMDIHYDKNNRHLFILEDE